jgi:hypothetical protein
VLLTTLGASHFQYVDMTVTGGTNYKYYVSAYNQLGGEGALSAGLEITPITEPSAPAAPVLVGIAKDFITVEWQAPADDGGSPVARYILYARAEYGSSYQ